MYYSAIGLLAVMILLIENQDILHNIKGAFDKPAWKVYRRFLFAVLAYYVSDILWGILEGNKLAIPLFVDTTVYFVTMAVGVSFWARFMTAYLEEKTDFGRIIVYAGRFLAGGISILAILNLFTPVLFTVDADCVYHALPMRYVMLVCQIALLMLISIYAFSNLRRKQKKEGGRLLTMGLFGLIMALFLFMQIWFPYLPLYSVAYMLGTCLLHTFVLNDEKQAYKLALDEAHKIRELRDTIVSLLNNMPAMTFTKDAQTGVYLACNQAFANYAHKATPADVAGLTDAQIFDAETAKHFMEDDKIALSMDEPFIFYEDVHDAAGEQRQFQTTKLKYYNTTGQLCVLGMSQDVTDMIRVQRENAMNREAYEKARSTGIIYTHIAQALARGYADIYYVNVDTEEYIIYRNDDGGTLTEVGRGWHFFDECRYHSDKLVHPDDRAAFVAAMERKTLMAALDRGSSYVMTYRMLVNGESRYVTMNVSRMEDDDRCIVLGVTDIDEQMKQRRAAMQAREERIAYTRLNALTGDFLCVYVVNPENDNYREFSAAKRYASFAQAKAGSDFFGTVRESARVYSHPDDLNRFLAAFTRENVLSEIKRRGIFTISYRLVQDGKPLYVQLKAAMLEEKEGASLIVGINDIDAQVRQEEAYVKHIAQARFSANVDALTGVKNRHAYLKAEERLNAMIAEHSAQEFSIVILDVNDLKRVNDTQGHKAGDQYLKNACKIICDIFKHSPVFRVGGDEFAVIAQGSDYADMEALLGRMDDHNAEALRGGGIVIACGMSRYNNDNSVAQVFDRADQRMYVNKSDLKTKKQQMKPQAGGEAL